MAEVERRPNARIERSALDEVRAIQTLLQDSYKDAGDGRTLVRELVQNADDAEASRLVFVILDQGLPDADNSLLRGPALLIANDGPFRARDWKGIHQALGGSKAEELGKVGRFGVGLKSAFHICEAVVYLGAEKDVLRPGVLNPWAGTGESGDADPIHPDWDSVDDADVDRLNAAATSLLGGFRDGLLLWVPLRLPAHLDRAEGRSYGLAEFCPPPDAIRDWFRSPDGLALLLAQCGHLRSIKAIGATNNGGEVGTLIHVERPDFAPETWVGRPIDDRRALRRSFAGTITAGDRAWLVQGVDGLGGDALRALRDRADWPHDQEWVRGVVRTIPRKALGHAAVTVLRASKRAAIATVRVRWAVFLPLDDDPDARPSPLVECSEISGPYDWDIVLHGYFWPSHDRRSIPSVTTDEAGAGVGAVRASWNRAVRDELLLPLLPSVLASAALELEESVARALVSAFATSNIVTNNVHTVTRDVVLLPVLLEAGIRFESRPRDGINLSIPAWEHAPAAVRAAWKGQLSTVGEEITFTHAGAPRIGGIASNWPVEWERRFLECITPAALDSARSVLWAESVVRHVLSQVANDDQAAAAADWLAHCIAGRALAPTTGQDDGREELRDAWRRLFRALPQHWLVEAPIDSQYAVTELASAGLIGWGLLPVPLGRSDGFTATRPIEERLDRALLALGTALAEGSDVSKARQRSRLLLAERLLAARNRRELTGELADLPLLRAQRLPDGEDEPWSLQRLHEETKRCRAFRKPSSEPAETEAPTDFRKAVHELASALGEHAWLVEHDVASYSGAPIPRAEHLAAAVLAASEIRSEPADRLALLKRFANDVESTDVSLALRVLLGGSPAIDCAHALYFVRSRDTEPDANRQSLSILLGLLGQSWRAVSAELAETLPQTLCDELGARPVDPGQLQLLLAECLAGHVDWSNLNHGEILHILQRMHGTSPEVREQWRAIPLHRRVGGTRGPIDGRTVRALGSAIIPAELAGEISLLDPDAELAHLYHDVPKLDDEGILRLMLASEKPSRFAQQILRNLRPGPTDQLIMPRDAETRALLHRAEWLPASKGGGIAPERLLLVPPPLQACVATLTAGGVFPEYGTGADADADFWRTAEPVVREILQLTTATAQLKRIAAAVDVDRLSTVDEGAYLVLPDADSATPELIGEVLQTPAAGSSPGWALLHSAAQVLGAPAHDLTGAPRDCMLALARAMCAPLPAQQQVALLGAIAAGRPARDSAGGRAFRALLELLTNDDAFFSTVLPHLMLPTQDGQWRPATEIARSSSGLARRHLLVAELRKSLRLDSEFPVVVPQGTRPRREFGGGDVLGKYFSTWKDRVPAGAIGSFLSLLGDGHEGGIRRLAETWLGEDVNVDGVRGAIASAAGRDRASAVKVFVGIIVSGTARMETMNVLGDHVEMEIGTDHETIFATDPARSTLNQQFWEILLRDVGPERRTAHDLLDLLGRTVEAWAVRVLGLDSNAVQAWWSRWGRGSQTQVGPVRASILANLPLTLNQLGVHGNDELQQALREAQRAQRRREQAPPEDQHHALESERRALQQLGELIKENNHRKFLWQRVQDQMLRFGYRRDSVLLELAQNADDALAQSAEISGGDLPAVVRQLSVRVHQQTDVACVDVTHYGRPINDTGGARYPEGTVRQWDQDLYFMMLLNLSSKPGEVLGRSSPSATTGRFGLGFKSVHLVSAAPSVVSGFLAFSIIGGLLPDDEPLPADPDLEPVERHYPTRIRLPLRQDADAREILTDLFKRFRYARVLIPVFARQIRRVVVDGGAEPGVSEFEPVPFESAPGWAVGERAIDLPGHGTWELLRFRPADAGGDTGTAAIAVGLQNGLPTPFPEDLPFLWNVTPTSEAWGCGYAVNGPFKLDPGRTHVSLDDAATVKLVDSLGESLGRGLVELHDALTNPGASHFSAADPAEFVSALWTVFSNGADAEDGLRRGLIARLHGNGRGLSCWMQSRSVVPTGMAAPFPQRLPPLANVQRIEIASGGLDDPEFVRAVGMIDAFDALLGDRCIVTHRVADQLRPFVAVAMPSLRPGDIFGLLANRWGQRLTPERLHALRPLNNDTTWSILSGRPDGSPWYAQLVAQSAAAEYIPLRQLLIPPDKDANEDPDVEEELLRSAFAPPSALLASDYIGAPDDVTLFRRIRGAYQVDAATLASWYTDLPESRHDAALCYLLHGRLHSQVLERIVPDDARPSWLADYDDVLTKLNALTDDAWRRESLLAALFPSRYDDGVDEPPVIAEDAKREFFTRFVEWWNPADTRHEVISSYEARVWPDWLRQAGLAEGLTAGSPDHWLALMILGACQSLGMTRPSQHRQFIENARREGWWDIFKAPERAAEWMRVLSDWQDRSTSDLFYARWMSLFPSIYQLSRFLAVYQRLLVSAGRRPEDLYQVTTLLAPRVDQALTGAGQRFDAPPAPLDMGVHWILRELVRLRVIPLHGDHLLPDCWVPAEQVITLLRPLGLAIPESGERNAQKARILFEFMATELDTPKPHLHYAFDIPLRHLAENASLRTQLGMEV